MAELLKISVEVSEPSFKLRIDLDQRSYLLRFDFNQRSNRWMLSFFDTDENPILLGIPLHIHSSLIGRYSDPRLPLGEMMLYDTSQRWEECAFEDLGARCLLLYDPNP